MARVFAGGLTRLKGKAGDYYYRKGLGGETIMAAMPRPTEKQSTLAQMEQRILWGNLVNAWQKMGKNMSFEAKEAKWSDYNAFMSANIFNIKNITDPDMVHPILAKGDAAAGYIVPFPYKLSSGSLYNPLLMERDSEDNLVVIPKVGSNVGLKGFIETLVAGGYEYGQRVTFVFLSDFIDFASPQFVEIGAVDLLENAVGNLPSFITYVEGSETVDAHYVLNFSKTILLGTNMIVFMINGKAEENQYLVGDSVYMPNNIYSAFSSLQIVQSNDYRLKAIASYGGLRVHPYLQDFQE